MPTLTFTTGNDTYEVNAAGSFDLTFLAGDDTLTLRQASATTVATMGDGADVVSHRGGTADVNGGNGADRFEIYTSGLTADGGADNDLFNIRGGTGLRPDGGSGNDRFNFYGASASIVIHGDDGADDFFGYGQAVDGLIFGGGGNDYFVGFSNTTGTFGSLQLIGGAGNDVYRYHYGSIALFSEEPGEGTDTVQVARGVSLYSLSPNIENISVSGFSGSTADSTQLTGNSQNNTIIAHNNVDTIDGYDGNDRLFGKGSTDALHGMGGDDYLDGGPGNDLMAGAEGNDTLNGRAGDDQMSGGLGNDTFYVDSLGDAVFENAGQGTDLVRVAVNLYVMAPNVERAILGGTAGLQMWGNSGDNDITGNSGNNLLIGMEGNDTVRGGAGDDFIYGYTGNDTLIGGDGNDGFNGEAGADTMTGGTGLDVFHVSSVSDSTPAAMDVITDFFSASGETGDEQLVLSNIDADSTLAGDQAFTISGEFPSGSPGSLWYESEILLFGTMDITWYGDVNGDGVADLKILIHCTGSSFSFDDITL